MSIVLFFNICFRYIMKIIDFSKTDNNIFISCLDGRITITDLSRQSSSRQQLFNGRGDVVSVSYSYNEQHVIWVNEDRTKINILSLDSLLNSLSDFIFTFKSDFTVIDYIVSPIHNHIAIIFRSHSYITISTDGQQNVAPENRNRLGLHIYDFSSGYSRLLFERYEDDLRSMSFSQDNKFAISGGFNVEGVDCGLIIVDLYTSNIISHGLEISTVDNIYLYPNLINGGHSSNQILIIRADNDENIKNIEVRNTITLEIIQIIETNIFIFDVFVSYNGVISLCTDQGLYCLNRNLILIESVNNTRNYCISEIAYSLSEDKFALVTLGRDPQDRLRAIPDNIFIYNFTPLTVDYPDIINRELNTIIYQSNSNPGNFIWNAGVSEPAFFRIITQQAVIEQQEPVIHDPQLDILVETPPTNQSKLRKYKKNQCYDIVNMNEENIGSYLSEDPDNLVIFFKNPSDADFKASCLTFSSLKIYLKNPSHIYYRCIDRKDYRTYHRDPPQYLKLPTHGGTLFVDYQLMKQKYIQRQNMIFLEHIEQIPKTITSMASITMQFVSRNHCQKGSIIDLYQIIF